MPLCFIWEKQDRGWWWTLKAENGLQIAQSVRGYKHPKGAQLAFDRMAALFDGPIDVQVWPW